MPLKAVIFDLDLTLIDSGAAESIRKKREWSKVYKMIPDLTPYEGIHELIQSLKTKKIKTAVVTSSPGSYCGKIIDHWGWEFDATVCYHDTGRKKPHPEPMLKALEKLAVSPKHVISIGDTPGDIISARSAGIFAVGCTWGLTDVDDLQNEKPDLICKSVRELEEFITKRLSTSSDK